MAVSHTTYTLFLLCLFFGRAAGSYGRRCYLAVSLLGSAYVAGRRSIGTMSRELRAIVDIMNQILEAPEQVPAEPYKQGELGELYTNLYKLVQALKESNRKEQEEKIFLRDIMSDISHQLKTPLASLTVFLDLLYDGRVPDVDKQKQMLLESKIRSAVWNGWCCPC